ncbi:hypothetical protein CR513_56317, partial [Mucuna pruriens]
WQKKKNGSSLASPAVNGNQAVTANSDVEVVIVEVEYIEFENLNDLEDVDTCLKSLLAGFESKDWVLVCDALNNGDVITFIAKSLKNPRSAVCKTAIMTSADIFSAYNDLIIDSLDPLLVQLLLKSSQDKLFVCEATERDLISMTTWTSLISLLPKLQPYLKDKNPRIRANASMCFSRSVPWLSLWGLDMDAQSIMIKGSAYHIRSLASLEVSKGLVKRVKHIVLKEALHKKELEKMVKANSDLKAKGDQMKGEVTKLKADKEGLWADLTASKSKATSMKTRTATVEAEVTKLKAKVAEIEAEAAKWKAKATTSKAEMAKLKATLALAKAKLEVALKAAEVKATALEAEVATTKKDRQHLATRVNCLEGAIVDQYEDGFNKALRQIALLVPDFDLSPYSITKEVKDGKLLMSPSLGESNLDSRIHAGINHLAAAKGNPLMVEIGWPNADTSEYGVASVDVRIEIFIGRFYCSVHFGTIRCGIVVADPELLA